MDYTITETDTLERVAASHDCTVGELMKLNKMASRMVFPGQKILVPLANSDDVFDPPSSTSSLKSSGNQISGIENAEDGIRKGPGGAVPAHVRRGSFTKTQSAPIPRGSSEGADTDCLQRFLKIKVKQVTESDGTVSGTLLVTPNCLMFDPDVSHPLVKENGPDLYGMVANMDEIQSVSVYKEIGGLTGDKEEKKRDIFDPEHLRTPEDSPKKILKHQEEIEIPRNGEVLFEAGSVDSSHSPKFGSDIALPAISEETKDSPCEESSKETRNRSATLGDEEVQMRNRSRSRTSSQASSNEERPRSFSELDTPSEGKNIGRFSPNAARRSFGKLGRTLSARAKSIQGTVTSGAEKVVGTAVQGTKTVAHGVVTHTKSAADTLQSGIENGAKAAADVAGRVVDKGQSLMSESINGVTEIFSVPDFEQPAKSPMAMKREQSLAKLQDLRRRTAEARENSAKENRASVFACATSTDEMPDLFAAVDEIVERSRISSNDSTASQPILPFYMAVRLTRNKKKKKSSTSSPSYDEDIAFGNKLKREFWFAVPRSQADNIYHFLLQWSPDKYGLDTTTTSTNDDPSVASMVNDGQDKGFIVLGSNADESLGVVLYPIFDHLIPVWVHHLIFYESEKTTSSQKTRGTLGNDANSKTHEFHHSYFSIIEMFELFQLVTIMTDL
uniref:LysM domain-containing protein n=1 Tax=Caenorhabditis tropicalis TaxID=1561998 RepID=A0A1I7V4E8_9PELO